MNHLVGIRDLPPDDIRSIIGTATTFREIADRQVKKVPTLRGRAMVTLFYENSTRTRSSFEMAAKILSAEAINIAAGASSVSKGESFKDTLLTLQAIKADCLVVRHSMSGAAQFAARMVDIPVINAGDGRNEHPTQALLDILTMQQHIGDVGGRTVTIVGDVLHSRVARSNIWALSKLGAHVRIVGPATLMPADCERLPAERYDDLDAALTGADVVNVLRIQTERMQAGLLPSVREYARTFGINVARVKQRCPDALIMHPGPMNRGVEISADVADGCSGVRSVITDQVTNGVAVRMAVLYLLMAPRGARTMEEPTDA